MGEGTIPTQNLSANALTRASRVAHRYVGAARKRLTPPVAEREQRVLFLFCGKSHAWRSPGRRLYRSEKLFRDGIDASDAIVREIVGFSPSDAFAGGWLPSRWDEEVRTEIVTMALTQMGMADLWRAEQEVEPGFLGLSGGEVAAAYGAGILSREEAVRTICWIAMCLRHPDGRCSAFRIGANARQAERLCRASPQSLEFGGEITPGISHVRSETEDVAEIRAFLAARVPILAEHDTSYRYHVPEMGVDEETFSAALPFVASKPSHAPLYLCSFGGRVPDGYSFGWQHWAWMVSSTYRMAAASSAACADGFNRVIVAGSSAIGGWHEETARRLGRPCRAINAFADGPEDESPWRAIGGQLNQRKLAPVPKAGPKGETVPDLADPAHLADPFSAYEALRARGVVHYLPRQDFWIVLGHQEAKTVFAQPDIFSNAPYDRVDRVLIGEDPPKHAAVRRIIARHFDAKTVGRLQLHAGALAAQLLLPRFDVVTEYAAPFARGSAAELIGLDEDGLAAIVEASAEAVERPEPFNALTEALDRLAHRATVYRRLHDEGEGLFDDDEVRSLVRFLWLAAITTTERVIARSAMRLVAHAGLLPQLRENRQLVGAFVEEVMRLNPPEHMLPRRTTQATMLGGAAIPAGADVELCITAANRDPALFEDPATFRLDRKNNSHLAFGSGIHHCSGTALARRLVPIAVGALVDAPGLHAIQPLETIEYHRTVKTLVPLHFTIGT